MTKPDDIDALLQAVRTLVSSREVASGGADAAPMVLTERQRIAPGLHDTAGPKDAGASLPEPHTLLNSFARLTLIAPVDQVDRSSEARAITDASAAAPESSEAHEALRAVIREVLREEVRTRIGPRINENIRRIVREELARMAASETDTKPGA